MGTVPSTRAHRLRRPSPPPRRRRRLRPPLRGPLDDACPDAAAVAEFHRVGTVADVVNATGLKHGVVMRILREAGITPPPCDRLAVAAKAAETRRQRRAAA